MRDGRDRGDGDPAQPARRARPAPRLDGRRRRVGGRRDRASWSPPPSRSRELSREQLENVLDMLDGRYPSEKFAELRPRLVWDRTAGTVRGRKGARQLAVTNAGTIPDRGLYGVHLPDGRRVGELDEEMVYEARPGQTFLLGATTWRIQDITRDRVIVVPAPGVPGAVPVLARRRRRAPVRARPRDRRLLARGGRPRTPRRSPPRTTSTRAPPRTSSPTCASSRRPPGSCPPTRRSWSRSSATRSATGASACSRRSAAACTPPGGWRCRRGSATSSTSRPTRSGPTTGSSSTCPTPTSRPTPTSSCSSPTRSRTWSSRELGGSALFGARFRENAARSLLIPRAYPGKRTPLWQQRLKSQSLLEVAKDFPRFPVILETYRECLRDVLDLPGADRPAARPAVAQDHPGRGRDADGVAVRVLAALRLRRHLHVRGRHAQRRAPRGGAGARSRPALGAARRRRAARADQPRGARGGRALAAAAAPRRARQGPRRAPAGAAPARRPDRRRSSSSEPPRATRPSRCSASSSASAARSRSGSPARSAGSPPRTRVSIATRSACRRPAACPTSSSSRSRRRCRRWCAATRAPTARSRPRSSTRALRRRPRRRRSSSSSAPASSSAASCCPAGREREWCDSDVLRRVRRASVAALRQEVEAVDPAELARFLPAWQNVDAHRPAGAGPDRLREALVPLQGVALTPRSGSATCCRAASAPTARPGSTS